MNFDITATPTLQAVASDNDRELVQDLQARVDETLHDVERDAAVVEAADAHRAAREAVEKLLSAARGLNEQGRHLREQIGSAGAKALDKLIESAASGDKPDYAQAATLAALEHRERLTAKAIERVVEHLTPLAQIARLRCESHALLVRAKAIEHAAQQRAERVLSQLRDAVTDEVVLPVDMSKGVAGALLTQSAEWKRLALEASKNADQLETWYMERNRK